MKVRSKAGDDSTSSRIISTPIGKLTLVASPRGLQRVIFGARKLSQTKRARTKTSGHLTQAERQLREYFAGERKKFSIKLDIGGTEFQESAWLALKRIGYGKTISYAQQARLVGKPKACRAVGSANGKNPVAIVLPCHRVIASGGTLGGYGGGLAIKRKLIALEKDFSAAG
ncbi:MAG: methylated-DNA--[protein]-cysteine S-methyltransferase [Actinobacteria bacterium]|nr:methylated-DNA--[protein]-cysteine S-methyltransferase [Actinomycetota bacterium]